MMVCKLSGRGVFATTDISKGQFVVQYYGEVIAGNEGDERESVCETGFRYFFRHRGSYYWYIASFHLRTIFTFAGD